VLAVAPVPRGGTGKCRRDGGATLSAQLLDHGYNRQPHAQAGIVLASLEGWKCEMDLGNHLPFLGFNAPATRKGRGHWPE